jgi:hypothetical protein
MEGLIMPAWVYVLIGAMLACIVLLILVVF